jgi:hypothetical protein
MPLLVPDPPAARAVATAAARRIALQQHLATRIESAVAVQPFRELPDRLAGGQDGLLRGPTAAAEIARLRWQSRSTGLLLLERAADLLEAVISRDWIEVRPGSVAISLEPLPIHARRRNRPPWRVVICAPDDFRLRDAFVSATEFLGIGVYLRAESKFKAFSNCTAGNGGLDGVVGGIVRSSTDRDHDHLVTCAHVIADGCHSLEHPTPPSPPEVPDAVLLRPNPCFPGPRATAQQVFPTDDADTARLQLTRSPIFLVRSNGRQSRGWLKYPVGAVTGPTGQLVRFPHYSVQPFRYRIGFLRWPPFHPHFARAGDSGSWVTEESTKLWVGMVDSGYDDHSDTLVADGRALLDYYYGLLTGRPPTVGSNDLLAYSWT